MFPCQLFWETHGINEQTLLFSLNYIGHETGLDIHDDICWLTKSPLAVMSATYVCEKEPVYIHSVEEAFGINRYISCGTTLPIPISSTQRTNFFFPNNYSRYQACDLASSRQSVGTNLNVSILQSFLL